jgi:hypothetical protein
MICLVFLLLLSADTSRAAAAENGSTTPLPDDIKIEPPGADVPAALAALSGVWQGELDVC